MGSLSEGEVKSIIEWEVRGTPSMVYVVVRSLSDEAGLTLLELRSSSHTTPLTGVNLPTEVFMRISILRSMDAIDLGTLSLQLLPGERTLLSIVAEPDYEATVASFMEHLERRLLELGFADQPPPPKRTLGFVLPD